MIFNRVLRNLTKPGKNLSERTIKSGFWIFSVRIVQQLFGFIRIIILARVLAPHDFGLMGIAVLTMTILETVTQTGLHQALIQKKDDIKIYLDAVWTYLILRGVVLFAILYLIAPYAATFFNTPKAKLIIQVIGFAILLQSFTNIGTIYFQKELEFNKLFFYQLSITLSDFIVAVSLVFILKNVWALVFGLLASNFTGCIVSYIIHPFKPRLSFDLKKVKGLFDFGKWVWGSAVLTFLITQGDSIFVGKFLGATALGFYQLAYRISNMPATEITHVISQVSFPAYSKLQDDLAKLREAYLRVLQVTAFLSFPIAGLIFVLAPDFTTIFLGEKWMPMVPAMQVLCIFGLTRSFGATTGPLFQGVGKPSILTKLAIIQLVMMVFIIYPLTSKYGILGTSIAVVIPNLITQIIAGIKILNIIKCDGRKFIRSLLFPLSSTSIAILPIFIFTGMLKSFNFFIFVSLLLVSIFCYWGISYFLGRNFDYDAMVILQKSLK